MRRNDLLVTKLDVTSRRTPRKLCRALPIALVASACSSPTLLTIQLLSYLFGEVLDGRNAHVTDGVQHGLVRERCHLTELGRAAASGIWNASAVAA